MKLDEIKPDIACYTSILGGVIKPNETTYEIIFGALCMGGELGRASQLRKEIQNKGLRLSLRMYLTLVQGFVDLLEEAVDKSYTYGEF
ncbi:hypothetical protein CDL15_Pgr007694 [Punica granatum]|nr:hypothetical protein CDL15_Pgr007694 [Punica granatum]